MNAQEIAVLVIGLATVSYIVVRMLRRRRRGTCCGEKECPAAKQILDRIDKRSLHT